MIFSSSSPSLGAFKVLNAPAGAPASPDATGSLLAVSWYSRWVRFGTGAERGVGGGTPQVVQGCVLPTELRTCRDSL